MSVRTDDGGTTDVLVIGAGPAGLCLSTALSRSGIASVVVERHPGTAIQPKALHLSTRTMEVLRSWGVADDVRAQALPLTDHAMFLGRSMADPDHVRHPIWPPDPAASAERSTLVSQEILEPVLRRHAERGIGAVRFRVRLVGLAQDGDGVTATLQPPAGPEQRLRARYVVGADGADSTVRAIAGIPFPGRDVHHSVNLRFRADLRALVADRRSAFYYVQNEVVKGLLPVIDNATDWRLHLVTEPGETPADYEDDDRRLRLIRAAVGVPDLDVELLPGFGWTAGARVADRYRHGRLLIAGDAAHVNPPSGGLGMNCGIQDVHNLAWKLAAVLRGGAPDTLLDTYEQERRPVALRTVVEAERNHEFEAAPIRTDEDRRRKHDRRRQAGIVLGQRYDVGAFVPDGTDPPAVADPYVDHVPCARPGHRAPHLWVGEGVSLLDLFPTDRSSLVTGPDGAAWRAAADGTGLHMIAVDRDGAALYGIGAGGAVLVRPDGIVAMRAAAPPEPGANGRSALLAVLARVGGCLVDAN